MNNREGGPRRNLSRDHRVQWRLLGQHGGVGKQRLGVYDRNRLRAWALSLDHRALCSPAAHGNTDRTRRLRRGAREYCRLDEFTRDWSFVLNDSHRHTVRRVGIN